MTNGDDEATFLDTNILVYAGVFEAPFHKAALDAIRRLDQAKAEIWLSRQILREYLSTLSRPQPWSDPVPARTLTSQIRAFESRFHIAEDNPLVTQHLLNLMEQMTIGGKQVHDANIVATMQAYGITRLLTHNTADFTRFSHLITLVPLDV